MKRIITIIAGVLIIVIALIGNYLMYKSELKKIESDYQKKIDSMEHDMKEVYEKDLTIESMTETKDANSIYTVSEKFITCFYSIDSSNDIETIEATLKKCMTEKAFNTYNPLASGSRGETEEGNTFTVSVSDIEVYLNYQNYKDNQISATILYKQKIETEHIDGEAQPFIWKGTFIKENGDWKVDTIDLDSLLEL